jgi:hypothetical protein
VINWVSPCLSFFLSASTAATNIFIAPTCTNTIITLDPSYALNAKFQHFIPRFNKIFSVYGYTFRGVWRWKEAQRQGDVRNNLSIYTYTSPKHLYEIMYVYLTNIYTGLMYMLTVYNIYTPYIQLLTLTCTTWKWTMENFHMLWSLRSNQMKNWLISDLSLQVGYNQYLLKES